MWCHYLTLLVLLSVTAAKVDTNGSSAKIDFFDSAFSSLHKSSTKDSHITVCTAGSVGPTTTLQVPKSLAEETAAKGSAKIDDSWYSLLEKNKGPNACYTKGGAALSEHDKVLEPFVSVNAGGVPIGTKLFVPQLKGHRVNLVQNHSGVLLVDRNTAPAGTLAIYTYSPENAHYLKDLRGKTVKYQILDSKRKDLIEEIKYSYSTAPEKHI
ncbi:hypothetical protein IWQ60_003419 [Tieghemiomyces parasiticus]|uniref:Uncharacterized protein n=1 Tax=Tieghemiomyces parasiticus TaxID=78921 RepID=A0A9W8DUT6_9FUNG|nr:hypothetical protein IWQ60_003419 [Tieghemiomyces parasiticus]